ncbi:DUF5105 domain-containing protein [Isobaculum melis]|uniref:DUF5105 domain-containing protein n=1 Tax=Isobaculum melis TaxID=142588 RepID=A0A1H9QID3_9LACT|nr:DUF5105 domain-containing protein [Isobaculum melis]SER59533.1 protein of unknown function [Isobaculum melis]
MTKKKMMALMTSLLLVILVIAGCGNKSVSAEKAGSLLIDRFVYDKESKAFKTTFSNAKELEKQANDIKDAFTEGFLTSAAGNMGLTDEDTDQLFESFMGSVKEKASYKIKEVSKDKDSVELEVAVTGLDFTAVLKAYGADLQKQAMKHPDLDQAEALEMMLKSFTTAIENAEATDEPVIVSLTLEKEQNKWTVDDAAMKEISVIFIATLLGVEDFADISLED